MIVTLYIGRGISLTERESGVLRVRVLVLWFGVLFLVEGSCVGGSASVGCFHVLAG